MSHAKQASTKRKRSINAVPVLSTAGLSLSLASGASAAIGRPAADLLTPKTGTSYEITLCEEEISDVSLETFYIFDKERGGTFRRGLKFAQGGGGPPNKILAYAYGGCGGGGGGDGGSTSTYSVAGPLGVTATRQGTRPTPPVMRMRPNAGTFRNNLLTRDEAPRIAANIAKLPSRRLRSIYRRPEPSSRRRASPRADRPPRVRPAPARSRLAGLLT